MMGVGGMLMTGPMLMLGVMVDRVMRRMMRRTVCGRRVVVRGPRVVVVACHALAGASRMALVAHP